MSDPIRNISSGLSSFLPKPTPRNIAIGVALAAIAGLALLWYRRSEQPEQKQPTKTDNPIPEQPEQEQPTNTDNPITSASVDGSIATQFIEACNVHWKSDFWKEYRLDIKEANSFLDRGGKINLVKDNSKIPISRKEFFHTGCTSAINRSQVARIFLLLNGFKVHNECWAGGDSHLNPFAEMSTAHRKALSEAFKEAFDRDKTVVAGVSDEGEGYEKGWFENYFKELKPSIHFILFATSGMSILRRLLAREGSLEGFTITYIPWDDEINHPPKGSTYSKDSREAYVAFRDKLGRHFEFVE
jgi:hypothetical protein